MMHTAPGVDDLRRILVDAAERSVAGAECPDPERFWEAQQADMPVAERQELVEHTTNCPACAEAWRLAHAMGAMEERAPQPVYSWHVRTLVAAAAVLFCIAGLWALYPTSEPAGEPVYRSSREMEIRSLIPENRVLPRTSFRLAWSPGAAETTYSLLVSTETFTKLFSATNLEHPECTIPPDNLEGLSPGSRILWQVEALTPQGRRITSDTFITVVE